MTYTNPEKTKEYQKKYRKTYKEKIKRVNLTLSKEEYRLFKEMAKKNKISIPKQIISLAKQSGEHTVSLEVKQYLQELVFLLRNVGNNINQIARSLNIDPLSVLKHAKEIEILKGIFQGLNEIERLIKEELIKKNKRPHDN